MSQGAVPTVSARSEFRASWRAVAGSFLGIAGGFSSLFFYSVGLFLRPMATEFGWSRGEASLQAVAIAVANVIAVPVAGRLVDRIGPLRPAVFSLLALSAGFVMLGTLVHGLASFLILSGVVTMLSAASNPVAFNRILVARFRSGRGLALGVALTAIGVGATLLPLVLGPLIAAAGWRTAYLALAAVIFPFLAGMIVLLGGMDDRPAVRSPSVPIRSVVFCRAFATIGLLIFLIAFPVLGTVVHLVPMLSDRGMSAVEAARIASALGIAVIGGRVLTGRLLDLADAAIVTAGILMLSATGMLLLLSGKPALLVPGAMLAGFGLGCESDLIAFLVGRHFPLSSFGTAYGCIFAAHVVGAGIGPYLAGVMYDANGDYTAWLALATCSLLAAAVLAMLTERGHVGAREPQGV